jgi:alpha-N-arabinofuranosidase
VVRWPGGCFADVYRWENGIGPRDQRPVVDNGHYKNNPESHQFGTDEFLNWCEQTGMAPYINVNLGSAPLEEALRWLEYCHGAPETPQGARRAQNGRKEPYRVPYWGIGNETWGSWEVGHSDAPTYAANLKTWATALRAQDPTIKILGVGSSAGGNAGWDRTVLDAAGDRIDYLTLHAYGSTSTEPLDGDYAASVFSASIVERAMTKMIKTLDTWQAAQPGRRPVRISIDEWNIRHYAGKNLQRKDPRFHQDALFVGACLNAMLRHSKYIGMANYVFLINGNGTLIVDGDQVVETTIAHVFRTYRQEMLGESMAVVVDSPTTIPQRVNYGGPPVQVKKETPDAQPWLDAAAARRADGSVAVALVNRHPTDSAAVTLALPPGMGIASAWTLHHPDPKAQNTFAAPQTVVPRTETVANRPTAWTCPPGSVVLLTCPAAPR